VKYEFIHLQKSSFEHTSLTDSILYRRCVCARPSCRM